jgi:membrane protein
LGAAFVGSWKFVQWPAAFVLFSTAIGLVYHFGPTTTTFADSTASYGAVGTVISVLIWSYVSRLAILIGAEMHPEIVNARHKDAGLPMLAGATT